MLPLKIQILHYVEEKQKYRALLNTIANALKTKTYTHNVNSGSLWSVGL